MLFGEDAMLSTSRWQNVIDYWKKFEINGIDDPDAIQVLRRMETRSSGAPLVVGNPAADLPDAEGEATDVGNILNVHPLVGESATVAAVSNALSSANLVHLAPMPYSIPHRHWIVR